MTTRSSNIKRNYEVNEDELVNDYGVIASDIIWEGSFVGESSSAGTARPFVVSDVTLGFAVAKVDNSAGAASAKNVRVKQRGSVQIPVTGAASAADNGAAVYATDDDTFTLTASGGTQIGKVRRWISGTNCIVRFEADVVRSI